VKKILNKYLTAAVVQLQFCYYW